MNWRAVIKLSILLSLHVSVKCYWQWKLKIKSNVNLFWHIVIYKLKRCLTTDYRVAVSSYTVTVWAGEESKLFNVIMLIMITVYIKIIHQHSFSFGSNIIAHKQIVVVVTFLSYSQYRFGSYKQCPLRRYLFSDIQHSDGLVTDPSISKEKITLRM